MMKIHRSEFLAVVCAGLAIAACATEGAVRAYADTVPTSTSDGPAVPTVLLPAGTPVTLILSQDLQSGSTKAGDVVSYQVLKPVLVGNEVLVQAGAKAYGKVTESRKPGIFGTPGKLAFTCEYIQVPGADVALRSNSDDQSGASNSQNEVDSEVKGEALSAALSGGVPSVGPGMLLGFMHGGGNVVIHAGQKLTMYVAGDTQIIPPAQPSSAAPSAPTVTTLVVNGQTLFILKSGQQITGTLLGFDGTNFQIRTPNGNVTLAASDVTLAKSL